MSENKFFIRFSLDNQTKNKLEKELREKFLQINGVVATESELAIIEKMHADIVFDYKNNGGRAQLPIFRKWETSNSYQQKSYSFEICDSLLIVAYQIMGEIVEVTNMNRTDDI